MSDNDDQQSDFDDAFRDEPAGADPPLKRFSRPGRGSGDDDPGSAATGEVERPSASGGRRARGGGATRSARPKRGGSSAGRRGGGRARSAKAASGAGGLLANPRARLGLGILFAIILVLVITLVVRDCQRSQLEDSYTSYLNSVAQIVSTSADQGQELRDVLSNSEGLRPPQLRERISAIGTQAQELVTQAEDLDPPGALSESQSSLVTLLQYRVAGLTGLAEGLPTLLAAEDDDFKAGGIAEQMQRFLASDVIYEDSFAAPARSAMEADDITGVEVPRLLPFLANDDLATADGAMTLLPGLQRTAAAGDDADGDGSADGNLRGNSLVQTEALPSETRLSPTDVTTVEASESLEWRVTVRNSGDFVENEVVVRATFTYPDQPNAGQTREASIPTIEPGQDVTITLPGPTEVDYRAQGNLLIEILPVPGEAVIDNNSAEYRVQIAL